MDEASLIVAQRCNPPPAVDPRANARRNITPKPVMPRRPIPRAVGLAAALAICATASIAHGQVYKCTDAAGKTTYADAPCAPASKPMKLPTDTKGNATDPNVCAQLLDETQRLAAEADRDAKRGRKESATSAKRRQALTGQYEARCVGIARSGAASK